MEMTPERWAATTAYVEEVFGDPDDLLAGLPARAEAAGLPRWEISPDVGRLLSILLATTPARRVLEIGTLGGYSGIWLARGLAPGGRLVTIERDIAHADFAAERFAEAGVGHRVEIVRGEALDVLPGVAESLGPGSVDLVFVDAAKEEYPDYVALTRYLVAPGGYLVLDNCLGTGSSWIDDRSDPGMAAVDEANRALAGDPSFDTVALTVRQGVLVARRR
ncbi:MAG: O-methyltransferase [Acidimicrobiia bacterium]